MVDGQTFKDIMARWASGICVITTASNGEFQGFTANSFASVSMEPALVVINAAKRLQATTDIQNEGYFAISILQESQLEWGKRFAGFFDDELENRFDGINPTTTEHGCPILPDSFAWLECKLWKSVDCEQNMMFIGEVLAGEASEGKPLLYHLRQWGGFLSTEAK